jgi:hypothetical protein
MEYSAKYRVSLSTLRRRIKSGELEHKLSDGKYLIKDAPAASPKVSSPSLQTSSKPETIAPPSSVRSQESGATALSGKTSVKESGVDQDQFWRSTQSLLNEIKKAYSLILQEKEEQILQLKEEVADLKTLVRVLEDDNQRLKIVAEKAATEKSSSSAVTASSLDFDLGLEL